MAETLDVPVAGPVKKTWIYVGLAGVAGVVGYAYWKRSQEGSAAVVEPGIEDYSGGLQTGGTGSTTGGLAYQPAPPPDDADLPPQTNAEWVQEAVSYLSQINFDAQAVSLALGKYLAKMPLVPAEADIVRTALGAIGKPPVGEFAIIMVPNPPAGGNPGNPPPPPPPPPLPETVGAPLEVNLYAWSDQYGGFKKLFGDTDSGAGSLNPGYRKYMRWDKNPDGSTTKIPKFWSGWSGRNPPLGIPPVKVR